MHVAFYILGKPFKTCIICLWQYLGVEAIPYGKRLNINLPKGVMNEVNLQLSGSKTTCWNPGLASNFE